jgi:drug/metabolite transporter (DMT)-like permease
MTENTGTVARGAYLSLVLATLFWGGNAVAAKLAVGEVSPMLINAVRWPIAVTILLAFSWREVRNDLPVMRRHAGLLFALGAMGMVGFSGLLYVAVSMTSAINVSIEQAAMPAIVMLANLLIFGMRARPVQIAGAVLTIAGAAVTALHGDLTSFAALEANLGDALMICGVMCYAAYTIFLRYRPPVHWKSLMVALMIAGTIVSLPFAIWEWASGAMIAPTATGWWIIAFTAIFPSLLAQPLYVYGTEAIGSNRASVFYNLIPIFGIGLSILVLGESFHGYHAAALALVVAGIVLAESRRPASGPAA